MKINDSYQAGTIFWESQDFTEVSWDNMPNEIAIHCIDVSRNGIIDQGDTILLTGLSPGTTYSFEFYHNPSESTMSMTGSNLEFTTYN